MTPLVSLERSMKTDRKNSTEQFLPRRELAPGAVGFIRPIVVTAGATATATAAATTASIGVTATAATAVIVTVAVSIAVAGVRVVGSAVIEFLCE